MTLFAVLHRQATPSLPAFRSSCTTRSTAPMVLRAATTCCSSRRRLRYGYGPRPTLSGRCSAGLAPRRSTLVASRSRSRARSSAFSPAGQGHGPCLGRGRSCRQGGSRGRQGEQGVEGGQGGGPVGQGVGHRDRSQDRRQAGRRLAPAAAPAVAAVILVQYSVHSLASHTPSIAYSFLGGNREQMHVMSPRRRRG